jgi:hypothetical protein
MSRLEEDNRNEKITKLLKELSKIDAPSNFETELSRRINQGDQKKEKKSWFDKIYSPQLIPSAALAITTVIIIFLLKGNINDTEDPFQIIPKLRTEPIAKLNEPESISKKNIVGETSRRVVEIESPSIVNNELADKKDFYLGDSNVIQAAAFEEASMERISVHTTNYLPDQAVVVAGGLNYKVIRVGEEERKHIEMLREKIDSESANLRKN